MSRWRILFCVGAATALLAATVSLSDGQNGLSPEADQLKQLTDRIADLEARVAAMEQDPVRTRLPTQPRAWTPPVEERRHWEKREFNGGHYYIVPLNTGAKAAR